MSHYTTFEKLKVQFKDADLLLKALLAMGVPEAVIERHEDPQFVESYSGGRTHFRKQMHDQRFTDGDKAHVLIRRRNIGNSCNDFGVYADENESVLYLCDYGKRAKVTRAVDPAGRYEGQTFEQWVESLQDEYIAQDIIAHHEANGEFAQRVEEDGVVYVYAKG